MPSTPSDSAAARGAPEYGQAACSTTTGGSGSFRTPNRLPPELAGVWLRAVLQAQHHDCGARPLRALSRRSSARVATTSGTVAASAFSHGLTANVQLLARKKQLLSQTLGGGGGVGSGVCVWVGGEWVGGGGERRVCVGGGWGGVGWRRGGGGKKRGGRRGEKIGGRRGRTAEQHVDIPVPGRGGRNAGLQGFSPWTEFNSGAFSQDTHF